MRANFVLLALACAVLAGCSLPRSRSDLIGQASEPVKVCSSMEKDMAAHRLGEAWRHCFWAPSAVNVVPVGNSFSAYRTTEFLLKEERRGDVTTLYTILPSPMLGTTYLLMADIQSTATCKSEITVWSANSHWRKRAEFTAAWLDNPEAKGSGLDCKR